MKHVAILVSLMLVISATASAVGPGAVRPPKVETPAGTPVYEGRVGGEDIPNAVVIPGTPFFDIGNTCGFLDDYDEVCPYTGSTSPDVVYSFTPEYDMCYIVMLCDSYYDTKVYIYEGEYTPGNPYDCNDDNDNCYLPPVPYTSWINEVMMMGGETYYIVVDGYGGDCGDYELTLVECMTHCPVECPPDGIPEDEPPCHDGYVDSFNAGCSSIPIAFSELEPSPELFTMCGKSGNFDNNTMRDTDWYLLDLTCVQTTVTACVVAEFPVMMGFIDLRDGCDNVSNFYSYVQADCGQEACLTEALPPGEWVVWVSTNGWPDYNCDDGWNRYNLTIDGYEACVPVESTSWGTVKALYR